MRKLSVIIPVYKVEAYVGQCLRSLLDTGGARPEDFELIVVNDGTPDNSMGIVRDVCRGHENVTIIEQENQGLSIARMAGLEKAAGKYVWFVDSDDWLVEGAVSNILAQIEDNPGSAAFVIPLIWSYEGGGNNRADISITADITENGRILLQNGSIPISASQRFIICRSVFSLPSVYFPAGLLHEDEFFGRVMLYSVERVTILKTPIYNYRQRSGSIMSSRTSRSAYDTLSIYQLLMGFMYRYVLDSDREWFHRNCYELLQYSYTQLSVSHQKKEFHTFKKENIGLILSEYRKTHSRDTFRKKIVEQLILLFPRLYAKIKPHYLAIKKLFKFY